MKLIIYTMPYSNVCAEKLPIVQHFCRDFGVTLVEQDLRDTNMKELVELKLHSVPCVRTEDGRELLDEEITKDALHALCATDIEEIKEE